MAKGQGSAEEMMTGSVLGVLTRWSRNCAIMDDRFAPPFQTFLGSRPFAKIGPSDVRHRRLAARNHWMLNPHRVGRRSLWRSFRRWTLHGHVVHHRPCIGLKVASRQQDSQGRNQQGHGHCHHRIVKAGCLELLRHPGGPRR